MSQDDLVRAMADYPGYLGHNEPEEGPPSTAQVEATTRPSEEPGQENWPDLAGVEVEGLKRELEQYQEKLEAIHERVASMKRETEAQAEAIRRDGEAKAREIIRKSKAEADILELRAQVRAEETRAREVARLWSRLSSVVGSIGEGGHVPALNQAAPVAEKEAAEETVAATEMAGEAAEPEVSPAVAEESEPAVEEPVSAEPQPAEEEAAPVGGEAVPDTVAQPSLEVRRYKVRGPLSFGSMVAIEQAAGRIPGVLSAKVSPSPDGGAILTVSTYDPRGTEQEIRQIPHLSWQLEEL